MAHQNRAEKHYQRAVDNVAEKALLGIAESKIAADMGQTRKFVRYWAAKAADPTLHAGTQGGARNCVFREQHAQHLVEAMLWAEVQRNPLRRRHEYAEILSKRTGRDINAAWVGRAFKRLNFSTKNAKYRNLNKFTVANSLYTARYMINIQRFDWRLLKFFDESRFDSREFVVRGWSARGHPVEVVADFDQVRSYSVSCLTDLTAPNGFYVTRPVKGSNDALDHLETIVDFIDAGVLRQGDILLLDNAKIHKAAETIRLLGLLLDSARVRMWFLPRYSPEFNPCELVFGRAKRYLRDQRGNGSFLREVLEGFGCVSFFDIVGFYEQCIEKPLCDV